MVLTHHQGLLDYIKIWRYLLRRTQTPKMSYKRKMLMRLNKVYGNLILTNHYERPFHPEIGSGVSNLLFEPLDPITANALTRTIGEVIANFEPRARVVSIDARPNLDTNSYESQ